MVLAVGTRLQDFTTGSWSVFEDEELRLIALNVGRYDATKHLAAPLVADAKRGLEELGEALGGWRAPAVAGARRPWYAAWNAELDETVAAPSGSGLPSYAAVIRTINDHARGDDYVVAAAGSRAS